MTHWISLYSPLPPPSGTDTLDIGPHCIETPWTWDLSVYRGPPCGHSTSLYRAFPGHEASLYSPLPVLISGGQDKRLVQTCSLEDPPGVDIWWLLKKHVRLMQVGSTNPTRMPSCLQCNQWTTIITMEDQLSLFQTTAFFQPFTITTVSSISINMCQEWTCLSKSM